MQVWQRVAQEYLALDSEDSELIPESLVPELRTLAAKISASKNPGLIYVSSDIFKLLIATDKSLALTIRDSLHAEIEKLIPGEFTDLYDTNVEGKGFRSGYISFGLQPASWRSEGIIGGILIKGEYDPSLFKSEATEPVQPGFKHSKGGGMVSLHVTACYYNKTLGGGCSTDLGIEDLGTVDVLIDAQEQIVDLQIVDSAKLSGGIKSLIKEISARPPDYAQSEKRKRKFKSPTGSPKSLLNWLIQNQRSDVSQSELESLARAMSARQERSYESALKDATDFFQKRGWAINPDVKPAAVPAAAAASV